MSEKKVNIIIPSVEMSKELIICLNGINNLKYKGELDKGSQIKVRFKDQRGIYLYWSPRTSVKKFRLKVKFTVKFVT